MNLDPLLPTEKNISRFRSELAGASEAELISQAARDPNMAPGIAAKQLLVELTAKREAALRKPHWTQTPGFFATAFFGVVGVIAWLYPKQPVSDAPPAVTPLLPASSPQAAAASHPPSLPAKLNSPAGSSPPSAESQSK